MEVGRRLAWTPPSVASARSASLLVDDGSAEPGVGSIGKERSFCILCV